MWSPGGRDEEAVDLAVVVVDPVVEVGGRHDRPDRVEATGER